jgi:signal transduction histidine kinase
MALLSTCPVQRAQTYRANPLPGADPAGPRVNLIRNAIESTTEEGVARLRRLWLRTGLERDGVMRIAAEDSGIGLDAATLSRIFEPFFTTKVHGMGLGLSMCRSIVERHGGQLWATSRFPRGSTLQFTLPVAQNRQRSRP